MKDELKKYGFSEKEVEVYISCLKLGSETASKIAIDSKIKRSTTYEILESLINKGIISTYKKENKSFFQAENPTRLVSILKEKEKLISTIIPDLEAIMKKQFEKPQVKLYVGKEGIKSIFEEIIEKKMDYWLIGNIDIFKELKYYFPNFIKRRIKAGIKVKILEEKSELNEIHKKTAKESNREIRSLKFKPDSEIIIYGNNVSFITVLNNEFIGVKITNEFIVNTQRQLFNILWENSE